jgi:hypothetical protein
MQRLSFPVAPDPLGTLRKRFNSLFLVFRVAAYPRRSVTPAAIQICVLASGPIIAPDTPTPHAPIPSPHSLPLALVPSAVGSESSPEALDDLLTTIGTQGIDVLDGRPKLPSALEKNDGLILPAGKKGA